TVSSPLISDASNVRVFEISSMSRFHCVAFTGPQGMVAATRSRRRSSRRGFPESAVPYEPMFVRVNRLRRAPAPPNASEYSRLSCTDLEHLFASLATTAQPNPRCHEEYSHHGSPLHDSIGAARAAVRRG